MDLSPLYETISALWERHSLPALQTFVSRKSLSPGFDPDWQENGILSLVCREAAEFGKQFFPKGDFEVLEEKGRSPCLFFSIPGAGGSPRDTSRTVFFYGHLDKQPPANGWSEGLGPWEPVIRDGRLYGRGSADDGYSVYAALTVIRSLEELGIPHPRCVGLIETREETGSDDLPYFLEKIRGRCGRPALVCVLDSGAGNYEQLWLTSSLRGACFGTLRVRILNSGMHSGTASAVVPSSFDIVRILLDRVQDPVSGTFKDPVFSVDIPAYRLQEIQETAKVTGQDFFRNFPWSSNSDGGHSHPRFQKPSEAMLAQCWFPSLSVTGAAGLPDLGNAGNMLRAETALRLSVRIPPSLSPSIALQSLKKSLTEDPPFNADVRFENSEALPGWDAPKESLWFRQACNESSLAMWGKPVMHIGEGGSIPILALFQSQFPEAQFAVTGVLGPGSNAHGANESLQLDYVKKFMTCIGHLVASIPAD